MERFNTDRLFLYGKFDAAYPKRHPNVLIKRKGKRVVVIEGEAPQLIVKKSIKRLRL